MISICQKNGCIACCVQTNMVLTNAEVELLESLGFDKDFFCCFDEGWIRLKNVDGRLLCDDCIDALKYE